MYFRKALLNRKIGYVEVGILWSFLFYQAGNLPGVLFNIWQKLLFFRGSSTLALYWFVRNIILQRLKTSIYEFQWLYSFLRRKQSFFFSCSLCLVQTQVSSAFSSATSNPFGFLCWRHFVLIQERLLLKFQLLSQ